MQLMNSTFLYRLSWEFQSSLNYSLHTTVRTVEFTAPFPSLGSLPPGPFCPVFAPNSGGHKTEKMGSLENLVLYSVAAVPKLVDYTTLCLYIITQHYVWTVLMDVTGVAEPSGVGLAFLCPHFLTLSTL